jgi:hypothetical protein
MASSTTSRCCRSTACDDAVDDGVEKEAWFADAARRTPLEDDMMDSILELAHQTRRRAQVRRHRTGAAGEALEKATRLISSLGDWMR